MSDRCLLPDPIRGMCTKEKSTIFRLSISSYKKTLEKGLVSSL